MKCDCHGTVGWAFEFCPLHAAAPDLLAACKRILKQIDDGLFVRPAGLMVTVSHLQAAVALAERKDEPVGGSR